MIKFGFHHRLAALVPKLCAKYGKFYDREPALKRVVSAEAQIKVTDEFSSNTTFHFSVGIPHYNRGALIHRPLKNILSHPAITEILIVDDGSSVEEYKRLNDSLNYLGNPQKVAVIRREENRGALETKRECVEKAINNWVLVLDSDNTIFRSYLNSLSCLQDPDPKIFYTSSWAFPCFPFHRLNGERINFENACRLTKEGTLRKVFIFNDGNYLVHRDTYLENVNPLSNIKAEAADVMVVNYKSLSSGISLMTLPGTAYYHRIDPSSFWLRTKNKSRERILDIFQRLEQGIPWDSTFVEKLKDA